MRGQAAKIATRFSEVTGKVTIFPEYKSNGLQIIDYAFVRKYRSLRKGSYKNTVPGNVTTVCHIRPTREQGRAVALAEVVQSHPGLVTERID